MPQASERNDPFTTFRFEVVLDGLTKAGFSECTGLSLEITTEEYAEGGENSFMHKFPGHTKQGNITLKRGIVDQTLWKWFYDLTKGNMVFKNGSIIVHDATGKKDLITWRFRRAFPVKWVGPDLNASQNAVAVETLELVHQGLTIDG